MHPVAKSRFVTSWVTKRWFGLQDDQANGTQLSIQTVVDEMTNKLKMLGAFLFYVAFYFGLSLCLVIILEFLLHRPMPWQIALSGALGGILFHYLGPKL